MKCQILFCTKVRKITPIVSTELAERMVKDKTNIKTFLEQTFCIKLYANINLSNLIL